MVAPILNQISLFCFLIISLTSWSADSLPQVYNVSYSENSYSFVGAEQREVSASAFPLEKDELKRWFDRLRELARFLGTGYHIPVLVEVRDLRWLDKPNSLDGFSTTLEVASINKSGGEKLVGVGYALYLAAQLLEGKDESEILVTLRESENSNKKVHAYITPSSLARAFKASYR